MKINILKDSKGGAMAKNEHDQVIGRRAADWTGATFTQAADELAKFLLAKHDNISISVQDVPMFVQVGRKVVWSAFDAGLSA